VDAFELWKGLGKNADVFASEVAGVLRAESFIGYSSTISVFRPGK
jgi:acetylglutamate kinase